MKRRLLLLALPAAAAGCAAPRLEDLAGERPALDLAQYFSGEVQAHGVFTNRSGRVVRRFAVQMTCAWQGDVGTLDERFTYSDGETQRRVWTLKRLPGGRYTGTADDVVGMAEGRSAGNAFQWNYTLRLPVGDSVHEVQFDDWMYLMDDRTMLNKATMSKFGVKLGEVTLAFTKR